MARPPASNRSRRPLAAKREFAERLSALMSARGLTVDQTAEEMRKHLGPTESFASSNLSHYRNGRSMPRAGHLEALGRALGVATSELVPTPPDESASGTGRKHVADAVRLARDPRAGAGRPQGG
jgi:transcriptional regulator with XRE-family HTH domain